MSLTVGISVPPSVLRTRGAQSRPFDTYRRWFIGYGLTGLVYSAFAWSVMLAGSGKSRVELALQLPLKGLIRLFEWVHCPEVPAFVITLFPPLTGLLCGLLALGACWAWRALDLRWERARFVVFGTVLFELILLCYGCANAHPHPGGMTLHVRGDSLLALALVILFAGGVSLLALSPVWTGDHRPRPRTP
jgi:hypothetical protein